MAADEASLATINTAAPVDTNLTRPAVDCLGVSFKPDWCCVPVVHAVQVPSCCGVVSH